MKLYLQVGWGMMEHCRHLLAKWGGGTVILSPRDLNERQLTSLATDIHRLNGETQIDPQFYLPHSDHARLRSHSYWPEQYDTGMFWDGANALTLLRKIGSLNRELGCKDLIVPGLYASDVDSTWVEQTSALLQQGSSLFGGEFRLFATIALSEQATRDQDQIHEILDASSNWPVSGIYLVCEHPRGDYLVRDPIWASNMLDLIAGIRLRNQEVIVGYSNQQQLIAAACPATAIASGNWMNVRSFAPERFRAQQEDEIKRHRTWYYCPQALSEYSVQYLDLAKANGILDTMAPAISHDTELLRPLFSARQPSAVGINEQISFRHYLNCLCIQANSATYGTYDDTLAGIERSLDEAETVLARLQESGVTGQHRDFRSIIEVNRSAIRSLNSTRGVVLRRKWAQLVG